MHLFLAKLHSSWYVSFIAIACLLLWLIGQVGPNQHIISLPTLINPSMDCTTKSISNARTFVIYSGGESNSTLLNQIVCRDKVINKQFGTVSSYWGVSDVNTISMLGNGKADLALVKENIMSALKAEETHGYKKVAYYPSYQSFLISLNEKPKLTKEYFFDKKIGLVVYPTSRSGHIVPKQLFTRLGLTLSRMNIEYASTHKELREMLISGEVDIIASFWQEEDAALFSKNYTTSIAESVSGTAWYLRLATENNDLLCSTRQFLLSFAKQQTSSYYKSLKLAHAPQCKINNGGIN